MMQTPLRRETGRHRPPSLRLGRCRYWRTATRAKKMRRGWSGDSRPDRQGTSRGRDAFRELTEPYRRELRCNCYRMLGSFQDAEDALQDTFLAAWQGIEGYEGRASLRTWLYRIATNRCLNTLRSAKRRPAREWGMPEVEPPEPTRLGEIMWLEPYPTPPRWSVRRAARPGGPLRTDRSHLLTFITALQALPLASWPCSSCATCSGTTRRGGRHA